MKNGMSLKPGCLGSFMKFQLLHPPSEVEWHCPVPSRWGWQFHLCLSLIGIQTVPVRGVAVPAPTDLCWCLGDWGSPEALQLLSILPPIMEMALLSPNRKESTALPFSLMCLNPRWGLEPCLSLVCEGIHASHAASAGLSKAGLIFVLWHLSGGEGLSSNPVILWQDSQALGGFGRLWSPSVFPGSWVFSVPHLD